MVKIDKLSYIYELYASGGQCVRTAKENKIENSERKIKKKCNFAAVKNDKLLKN